MPSLRPSRDISYDDHAKLLYKLAGQVVSHLRSYLSEENDVVNALQYDQQSLVNLIHSQMQDHFSESAASYEAHVTKGFRTLRPNNYTAGTEQHVRNLRTPVPEGERNRIKNMLFGGFQKCLYPIQKFDFTDLGFSGFADTAVPRLRNTIEEDGNKSAMARDALMLQLRLARGA